MTSQERNEAIREEYKGGSTYVEIAKRWGMSYTNVARICKPEPKFPLLKQKSCGFRDRAERVDAVEFREHLRNY